MDIFLRTEEHLTSEDLYWLVQKEDPSIGNTTVYRTLKLLTEAGLAREVRFGDNKTYYEHHYNHQHHDHMICTECGEVIEFFSPDIEALQDQMAEKFGFQADASQPSFMGTVLAVPADRERDSQHAVRGSAKSPGEDGNGFASIIEFMSEVILKIERRGGKAFSRSAVI